MKRCAALALPEIVWALGRIAYQPACGPLLDYLTSEEEAVRFAAAVALARIGEPSAVNYCFDEALSKTWAIVPLALTGGRSALHLLTELAEKHGGADCFTALGLLGDPVSIPLLISRLVEPVSSASASTALYAITGADLYETVFVPDQIDADELFDSEREQLEQGKMPDRGDGRPFGSTVTRLSQNPEDWSLWLHTNASRFNQGVSYRNGGPISPSRIIEMLTAERAPHQLRMFCSEELATRYRYDFGLETDLPVPCQIKKLAEAAVWDQSNNGRYEEGAWYFAGHRCT
jgi:hypothetical protein